MLTMHSGTNPEPCYHNTEGILQERKILDGTVLYDICPPVMADVMAAMYLVKQSDKSIASYYDSELGDVMDNCASLLVRCPSLHHGFCLVASIHNCASLLVLCPFFGRILHSRMPLVHTPARLKLLHACGQCHSSRVSTASYRT
jgi:hypothetical protein